MLKEEQVEAPPYLYKYRSCNERGFRILENSELYFAALNDLNDPFECRFVMECRNDEGVSQEWLKVLGTTEDQLPGQMRQLAETMRKTLSKKFNFCCLSEKNDDILSFSHYSDCHQGFCIGFYSSIRPFFQAGKVRYQTDLPQINIMNPDDKAGFDILLTKAKIWEYEQEWRIVKFNMDKGWYEFPEKCLRQIILGCKISQENEKKIMHLLEKKNHRIEVFRAIPKESNYFLSIEKVCDVGSDTDDNESS